MTLGSSSTLLEWKSLAINTSVFTRASADLQGTVLSLDLTVVFERFDADKPVPVLGFQ